MTRRSLLVACTLGLVHLAAAAQVTYLDGASYINAAGADQLTAEGVVGVLGSLLDAETPTHSQAGVSEQVETILSPSVFRRPAAVLAVQVLGAGDALSRLSRFRPARSVPVSADASTLLQAVASVVNSNQQSFVYKALDNSGLPSDCGERCKEQKVHDAVMARGFNYTAHEQPSWDCDAGPWCFQIKSGEDRVMNMGFAEDKQFAFELGMLRHKALEAAETFKAGTGAAGPPKLLEVTLVGLQAVRAKYGADSKQATAAAAMLAGTLEEVWAVLLHATGGRAVAQLAAVDVRPDAKLPDMQQWLLQHRAPFQRRLLQQDGEYHTTDFGAVSVNWATSSVAWLISIILLVFIIASAVCLCNMKFEQDTMLYASKKAD